MAFPTNTFILLITFLSLNVYAFAGTIANPLNSICNKVSDRSFCLKNIGSDPNAWIAGLPLLSHAALVNAEIAGIATNNTIHSLRVLAVDPHVKDDLSLCELSYVKALNAIKSAYDDLKSGNYRALRLHAARAMDAAGQCGTSFRSPFESLVTVENLAFKKLCNIVAIIADDLKSAGK